MRCPACGTRLVEVERAEVMIDACPECRGVWLDRGELDRLLERERRSLLATDDHRDEDFFAEVEGRRRPAPVAREAGKDRDRDRDRDRYADDRYRKKKKRRGLLEDIFDFDF